jgi:hypothetical protein
MLVNNLIALPKRFVFLALSVASGTLFLLVFLTLAAGVQPAAANGATVWLRGPDTPVYVGQEITVTISISDVVDLFGLQLEVNFNPDDLQAVDADPGPTGVQIEPADCPAPDLPVENQVNNTTGLVEYAVAQLAPTPPVSGNCNVAYIRFLPQQESTTTLTLDNVILADSDGMPISSSLMGLSIEILQSPSIPEPVVADFDGTPTSGKAPLLVNFSNLSSGDFDSCLWDFGDGDTSTDCSDPVHIYSNTGVYTVGLMVSGPGGTDSANKPDYISVQQGEYLFIPFVLRQ